MAYLEPKGEGDNSMPGNRRSCPGVRGGAPGDPRDMAKAGLPEAQSPEGANATPAGKTPVTGAGPCGRVTRYLPQSSGARERCPVRAFKETNGTPKSRYYVRQCEREIA